MVPEGLVDVRQGLGDGVAGGKQRHRGPLRQRRTPRHPHGQHDGDEHEDTDGDPRPGRDQPAEPIEDPAHGVQS